MARDGAIYVCQSCGAVHGKWSGQCGACGQWNSIVEESRSAPPGALKPAATSRARGVQFETLLALSDEGAPAYDREHAAALAALGAPAFACTPDLFPEVMAAAIEKRPIPIPDTV